MPKALIVRNYPEDNIRSMECFADMLVEGLPQAGWEVETVHPPVNYGKGKDTNQGLGKWLGYLDKYLFSPNALKSFAKQSKPDLVHITDHSNAPYLPIFRNMPALITCHDLLAVRSWLGEIPGQTKSFTGGLQQKWIFSNLRKAPCIPCISEATRNDLQRLAPETKSKLSVIPVGLNYPYERAPRQEALERIATSAALNSKADLLSQPFILHVGNNAWYKNRIGTLEIFKEIRKHESGKRMQLIMAGAEPDPALKQAAAELADCVHFACGISNQELEALYSLATCLIFPSLAEGFGWPPIEAQACGCPVVVSDIEPIRSNCSEAALYFKLEDYKDAAKAFDTLMKDSGFASSLTEKGLCNAKRFTADAMIRAYVETYQELLNENSTHR